MTEPLLADPAPTAHHHAWSAWADERNDTVRAAGQWRRPRAFDAAGPTGRLIEADRDVVSFASNDYLGLTRHPAAIRAAHDALDRWGTGSGAARLIVGNRPVHDELEATLASWRRQSAAQLYPTGFMANLGVLATLAGPDVRICSDELNHASIIDGARLARANGAELCIYRHNDLDHLDELLADAPDRTIVVSDSVFSMDGDLADVSGLLERCGAAQALLVLDEAHAVLGPPVPDDTGVTVLRVGTLSKALGSQGGYVAGPQALIDVLVNRSRPSIFTTGLAPADAAAALASLHVVTSSEGDRLRARLRATIDRLSPGWPSPILPLVIGDEAAAVAAADQLLGRGLWVPAIRPPTVAPGTSRLRIALSAAHTDEHIDELLAALDDLGLRLPASEEARR